jgi:hypothetical protein
VRKLAQLKKSKSVRRITAALAARGTVVGRETVRRVLVAEGLKPRLRPRRPKQLRGDKKRRMIFASEQKERDWTKVWFADEKRFSLFTQPNHHNDVTWTDDASSVEPAANVAHAPSINAYASFSARGKTSIHLFSEMMTAVKYVEILDATLMPAVSECMAGMRWCYLQDNDPKHRARLTQEWLEAHASEFFAAGDFPPRSPDLNPMENAWAMVGEHVARAQPQNLEGLKRCIRAAWQAVMTDDYCRTLAESMPHRLLAVRRARGGHTTY